MAGTMNWGVLSTAGIGVRKVIPAMRKTPLGNVLAIASRNAERAEAVAGQLGIERAYGTYEALLADPDIEAVYNSLPIHLHVEWSVRAMEAGKHVLCEKPIALGAGDVARLVEARQRTGRQVLEAVMVRQHPQWLRAREIVRSGELGPLVLIQTTMGFFNDDPNNIRNRAEVGGGALYDIGCYAIFLARFMFEAEPVRVVSLIDRDPVLGTDRLTGGLVDFGGGRQLSFACSTQLSRYQNIIMFGRSGRLEVPVSLNAPQDGTTEILIDPGGDNEPADLRRETFGPCDQYTLQAEYAARVFRGEIAGEFPIEDAAASMRVVDALYRSAETGAWQAV
ncbi:MAG: Gfo/Idh/MocA family oxidoreductase [Acuticoccus sp.]